MAPVSPNHRQGCARLGFARLNAFRLNVFEATTQSIINGVPAALRIEGASISHLLNEQVDTASFRTRGVVPVAGQRIQVFLGDTSGTNELFGGRILETTALYERKPQNVAYDVQCIDPTWLLNRRKVLAYYVNQSATAIAIDLIARFARGTTVRNVVAGLPVVDAITFTNESLADCLTAICQRIGGSWYVDYAGDLHLFLNESINANDITDANPRGSADHQLTEDLSQVVTRVIGRGGGANASLDMPIGSAELPVDENDQTWYSTNGGLAEIGTQVIQYSGIRGRGGKGSFVGSGNAPSGAPVPSPTGGSSHTPYATYKYAASYTTASGETLPSPEGSITLIPLAMAAPPALSARTRGGGTYPPGMITPGASNISFKVQIAYKGGAIGPVGAASVVYAWDGNDWEIYLGYKQSVGSDYYYPLLEPGGYVAPVSAVAVLRSDNGGPFYHANYAQWTGSAQGWYKEICTGYSTSPPQPVTSFGSVIVRSLPIANTSSVTGRKLYRTTANGSALKLLTSIANNTATEYADNIADAALGAAPPASDTSGIKDEGQVPPGATALPVASTTPFAEDASPGVSGWVRVGAMPVSYSGISAGTLTGIPASGAGSITAAIRFGTQVLVQPRLYGIPAAGTGSIVRAILRGDNVTIRLERQDDAACSAMAARFGSADIADGIIEDVISDSRFGLTELADQLDAFLLERKDPNRTVTFTSRDTSLQVGRLITINLTNPPITGTYRIQRITFSEIAITGGLARLLPLRRVEATNKLFTVTDLLRQLRGREGGVP